MRSLLLIAITAAVGCATKPEARNDESQIPTDQEVLRWLSKVPHVAIWGVSKWESEEERHRAAEFDYDAWLGEGKGIPDIETVLRRMLQEGDSHVDLWRVAYALGKVGNSKSVSVLIECLDSQDASLQMQAIIALGSLRDPRAVPPLGTRLMLIVEHDATMLSLIVSALAEIGDERALDYLDRAALEGDAAVSELARELLGSGQESAPIDASGSAGLSSSGEEALQPCGEGKRSP